MELKALFEQAATDSKLLTEKPSNETLLQLYSLYKQSVEGDNSTEPPSNPFDFEAWTALKGKSREEAMQEYIKLVEKLKSN